MADNKQYRDYEDEELDHGASLGRGGVDPELHPEKEGSAYSGEYQPEDTFGPSDRANSAAAHPKDAKYDATPTGKRRMDDDKVEASSRKNKGDFAQENYGSTAEHARGDREWMNDKK